MANRILVHLKEEIPIHGKVRIFTEEEHGKEYKAIAEKFAKTNPSNVLKVEEEKVEKTKRAPKGKAR